MFKNKKVVAIIKFKSVSFALYWSHRKIGPSPSISGCHLYDYEKKTEFKTILAPILGVISSHITLKNAICLFIEMSARHAGIAHCNRDWQARSPLSPAAGRADGCEKMRGSLKYCRAAVNTLHDIDKLGAS